jgi:hypothetical protein
MQIGVVFPTSEIGSDVGAVRAYALVAEELGYRPVFEPPSRPRPSRPHGQRGCFLTCLGKKLRAAVDPATSRSTS